MDADLWHRGDSPLLSNGGTRACTEARPARVVPAHGSARRGQLHLTGAASCYSCAAARRWASRSSPRSLSRLDARQTPAIPPFLRARLAGASAEAGAAACAACHSSGRDEEASIGSNLWGVVNRPVASEPGFDYSDALLAFGGSPRPGSPRRATACRCGRSAPIERPRRAPCPPGSPPTLRSWASRARSGRDGLRPAPARRPQPRDARGPRRPASRPPLPGARRTSARQPGLRVHGHASS